MKDKQDELLLAEIADIITSGIATPSNPERYVSSNDMAKEILAKAKPIIEKAERERIFKDIDNAGLIGQHTDSSLHETGATIIDCPACCWYAYKALQLEEG